MEFLARLLCDSRQQDSAHPLPLGARWVTRGFSTWVDWVLWEIAEEKQLSQEKVYCGSFNNHFAHVSSLNILRLQIRWLTQLKARIKEICLELDWAPWSNCPEKNRIPRRACQRTSSLWPACKALISFHLRQDCLEFVSTWVPSVLAHVLRILPGSFIFPGQPVSSYAGI